MHRAIYRALYPFFDKIFVFDSYSCRNEKGTHKAMNRFRDFAYRVGKNHTKTCWVLKCDIKKFFANVDHKILLEILRRQITDQKILQLLAKVIHSFHTKGLYGKGLPLGNLTSQLFANIYLNEFDQFVKHNLKEKCYVRYADDFVILSGDQNILSSFIFTIKEFLSENLKLILHPDKVSIKTIASGVDFLGWINFPDHRVLRTATKKRMFRKLTENPKEEVLCSYLGLFEYGNAHILSEAVSFIR